MSNREASIKIKLDSQEFVTKVKGLGDEADKAGTKIGSSLHAGFTKGAGALKGLFASVTSLVGMGAVLGGAFSFKQGIQDALSLDGKYRAVARTIRQISGDMTQTADVQKTVAETGKHTGESLSDLTEQYMELLRVTGDVDFSKTALSAASQEATRTGKSFANLSSIAGALNEKFGITGKGIDEALRMISSNVDVGGPKLEELAGGFDKMSAIALAGGLKGASGLKSMLGILNETDNVLGGFMESSRALQGVFSAFGAGGVGAFNAIKKAGGNEDLLKKLINTPDALQRLDMVLRKGGAVRKEFEKAITDRKEMALYKILTEPFDKSVEAAMKAGKKGQAANEEGAAAFQAALDKMARAGDSKAAADAELAQRMESNKVKIDQALKEVEAAFAQPEVIAAVKDLIGVMPPLVHGFASLLKLVEGFVGSSGGNGKPPSGLVGAVQGPAAEAASEIGKQVAQGKVPETSSQTHDRIAAEPWYMKAVRKVTGIDADAVSKANQADRAHMPESKAVESASKAIAAVPDQQRAVENASRAIEQAVRPSAAQPGQAIVTPLDGSQSRQVKAVEKSADVHEALTRNVMKAASALERLANSAGSAAGSGSGTGDGTSKGPGGVSPAGPGWADKY